MRGSYDELPESHAAPLAAHNQLLRVHIEIYMGAGTSGSLPCKRACIRNREKDANLANTLAEQADRTGALPGPIQSAFCDERETAPCSYNCSQLSRTLECLWARILELSRV